MNFPQVDFAKIQKLFFFIEGIKGIINTVKRDWRVENIISEVSQTETNWKLQSKAVLYKYANFLYGLGMSQ